MGMFDDLRPTPRLPAPHEIVGLVALALPFLVSTASSSSSTVDGEVVSFVYRDWTAVGGGVVAVACGAISLLLLRRTVNKLPRIAIAVALLAIGGFHIARGFGVMAPRADTSTTTTVTTVSEPEIPRVDLDAPVRELSARWSAGKVGEIYRDAHPKLREAVTEAQLVRLHLLIDRGFGKLDKLGTLGKTFEDRVWTVKGPATFERGELQLRLEYAMASDTPKLLGINLDVPKALQRDGKPEDADQLAISFAETLLAGKLDRDALDPRVVANLGDDTDAKLEETRKAMGPRKQAPLKPIVTCQGEDKRCLQFKLRGTQNAEITVELEYAIRSWLITKFNFTTG